MLSTNSDSKDNLKPVGYTWDALREYISRQLGAPTWTVELTSQQINDAIGDALQKYSTWRPQIRFGSLTLIDCQTKYLDQVDVGQGIIQIDFVENRMTPGVYWFGGLLPVVPLPYQGMAEFDSFLRWQKTFMRVTSAQPMWQYDDFRKCLWIHNPMSRYLAGIQCFFSYTDTKPLDQFGAGWVKEYALEKARYLLGDVWMKFSGSVPGPVQNTQLDSGKRDKAETRIKELEDKLFGAQQSTPMQLD